jgi:hypothetical protein
MKRVAFYLWIVDSETPPGRRVRTRHKMDEATAIERGGNPVRVEASLEWRNVGEPGDPPAPSRHSQLAEPNKR